MSNRGWGRVGKDLRNRKYVEVYSISIVAFSLAILSLVPDFVPDAVRWAALLAGVGTLVLRIAIPDSRTPMIDEILENRFAFDSVPFSKRLEAAREVWIFAPSAINILSPHNCEILRKRLLVRSDGLLRVVVLNPANSVAIELAARQLDDSLDYPAQDFGESLKVTTRQLLAMSSWRVNGSFEYGYLDYNPGFSLVAIDPTSKEGRIIVEFHGFHNESTSSRMHIEISRQESEQWFAYWGEQFSQIWRLASSVMESAGDEGSTAATSGLTA